MAKHARGQFPRQPIAVHGLHKPFPSDQSNLQVEHSKTIIRKPRQRQINAISNDGADGSLHVLPNQ